MLLFLIYYFIKMKIVMTKVLIYLIKEKRNLKFIFSILSGTNPSSEFSFISDESNMIFLSIKNNENILIIFILHLIIDKNNIKFVFN